MLRQKRGEPLNMAPTPREGLFACLAVMMDPDGHGRGTHPEGEKLEAICPAVRSYGELLRNVCSPALDQHVASRFPPVVGVGRVHGREQGCSRHPDGRIFVS